jgi:hypothetical protein
MRMFPKSRTARIVLALIVLIAALPTWNVVAGLDQLFWPQSAKDRIENMASTLRRIQAPSGNWCYPSDNAANLSEDRQDEMDKCITSIAPVSDYIEEHPGEYIKRFYRSSLDDRFCDVTLSTVYRDDRIVGYDCYYGLFLKKEDTGVGMTDDKFG